MSVREKMTDIADKIRKFTGKSEKLTLVDMPAEIAICYEKGKMEGEQAVYDDFYDIFWDSYQNKGNRTEYSNAFSGAVWTQDTFKPKYPMRPTSATSMFKFSNVTDLTTVDLNFGSCGGFFAMCREAKKLTKVGNIYTVGASNIGEIFYGCTSLVSVGTITVKATTAYNNSFYNNSKLANIIFAGTIGQNLDIRYSPLNKASVECIIGCLSATETGKSLILNKAAKEAAFTDEEWAALTATKTNWTISLM